MAASPLYVADMDTLKAQLRLTAVDSSDDSQAILDRGVRAARTQIYARLGSTVANAWTAVGYSENPTTEQGVLREVANLLEIELVFVHLLDNLPHFFMDDSGGTQHEWNETGAFRGYSAEERTELRRRKKDQIEEYFELLSGEDDLGDDSGINIHVGESEIDPKPTPGGSSLYLPDDGTRFDGNFRRTGHYPQD